MNLKTYKKRRLLWLNSSFNNGFNLNDNKIYEIFFDLSPFQLYKNTKMKVVSYTRDDNQSKPIVVKLKDVNFQRSSVINTDNEGFPIIYFNHTGVEGITYNYKPTIILTPQQIPRITLRLDDDYNNFNNGLFGNITNGEILRINNYQQCMIFKTSGSFVLNKNLSGTVDILIVGGGGAGGRSMGGGGGAGGVVYVVNQTLNAGTYSIIVGAGGIGEAQAYCSTANDGGESAIMNSTQTAYISMNMGGTTRDLRAFGGGGGGAYCDTSLRNGRTGGSGGGAAEFNSETTGTGGAATQPATMWNGTTYVAGGTSGNSTVVGEGTTYFYGGGGGGAGGTNFNNDYRNGKTGVSINITGTSVIYAAGGGPAQYGGDPGNAASTVSTVRGLGGDNIGGQGEIFSTASVSYLRRATSAIANTGSGGGGIAYVQAPSGTAGSGGSGIVIIKFNSDKRIEGITPVNNKPPPFILGLQLEDE